MPLRDKDRDQDKPAADLLRRSLAAQAGAPGSEIDACPDPEILAAYAERSLDADEAARCNLHFSQCARCREQLVVLVRARDSAGTTEEKRPRRPSMVWDWRWLAPATAAIVFVVVVQVFRPPHHSAEQSRALVAMNQTAPPPAATSATPVTRESAPAANVRAPGSSVAGAPSAPIFAPSRLRSAPTPSSVDSEIAGLVKKLPTHAPAERKESAASPAPQAGEFSRLEPLNTIVAAPKSDASSRSGIGHGSGNAVGNGFGLAAAPPGTTQTVTVDNAAPPVVPAAPAPAARAPAEKKTAQANGAVSADAIAPRQNTTGQQVSVVVANRDLAQTETLKLQAGDATFAQMLIPTPDPQVLWRFSSGRFVERSADAGATWRVQWTNPSAHLVAGAAPATDTCWLVGRDAMILLTVDGRKWKTITPPAEADFVDVTATDAFSATITASDGRKFTTSDSGKHWTPAP